tara:strand:+ start:1805 stop:2053 length:249 start_codon:yes stop_codon:yes gene_type:complete
MKTENKVLKIFERFFKISKKELSLDLNQKNFSKWDSINHLSLVFILEEEFKIKFDDKDIFKLISIKKIIYLIENKYKKNDKI